MLKKSLKALAATAIISASMTATAQNPLFGEFTDTPRGTIPFDRITTADYEPAIDRGIELGQKEIDAIANNPEAPTFENTIVALDRAGEDLNRVLGVFYPLLSSLTDDAMMELSIKVSPRLAEYSTRTLLNRPLWLRIKQVRENTDTISLTPEQRTLLKETYDSFARNGALLEGADREEFSRIATRLSELTTIFGQNVLKELNTYEVWLGKDDLAGLPESSVEAAALAAREKGRDGEYLFTLDQPVYMAFMKYSSRRDLREKMYRLYSGRNRQGEFNNIPVMQEIANLRLRKANLLGYKNYASYSLANTMAKNPDKVNSLLTSLRDAYRPALDRELAELNDFASRTEGTKIEVKPWDYSYYSNKLKNARYAYNEEEFRPYFELNNVIEGVFGLATRLYGVTFEKNPDIPVYHPDVTAFEVKDADGSYLGVLYTDFFPRASKSPGAWETEFKTQHVTADGTDSRPHVSIVMNFTKPTGSKPSLLTPYEVETFLHEFGHSLHSLLTKCNYTSLAGTNVLRDFVELPSQFNENYLTEKEFLDGFARHYETGEKIPAELVDRLVTSSQFGAAYACMRQLGFGTIDMAWHSITEPVSGDAADFERKAMESVSIFAPVEGTMTSPTFSHIFAGGYAAGYYSYKWAEVLDADAFAHFKENGIFDPATARSFRTNVLEKGGSEDPAELYRRFRGHDATIDALLKRDGITAPAPTLPADLHDKD